jgi:hypothetical protein
MVIIQSKATNTIKPIIQDTRNHEPKKKPQVLLNYRLHGFPETVSMENLPMGYKTTGLWEDTCDPVDLSSDGNSRRNDKDTT